MCQTAFAGPVAQQGNVCRVKTAYDEGGSGCHLGDKSRHVGKDDVAMDIGHHDVESSCDLFRHLYVAMQGFEAFYTVECGIVAGIVHAPLVDVVAYT